MTKTERYLDNFGIIAEVPGGVDEFRNLIIRLAISGQLVRKEAHSGERDGTVSSQAGGSEERAASRTLPERRYSVPLNWQWVSIADEFGHQLGRMLNSRTMTGVPRRYLRSVNIKKDGSIDLSDLKEIQIPEKDLDRYSVEIGDLFVIEGGDVGRNAIWALELDEPLAFQNQLHRLRSKGEYLARFLQLVLEDARLSGLILELSAGVTIKHLSASTLRSFIIPKPPLPEQQRIVTKVDELMLLCDEMEKTTTVCAAIGDHARRSSLDALLQAETPSEIEDSWTRLHENWERLMRSTDAIDDLRLILMELAVTGRLGRIEERFSKAVETGEAGANVSRFPGIDPAKTWKPQGFFNVPPSGWTELPLAELGVWGSGSTPSKTNSDFYGGDIPWLVIGDLSGGVVTRASTSITEKALQETAVKVVPVGAVLVAMYGASIGKTGIAGIECTTNQAIAHCVPKEGLISTEYLHLLVRAMKRSLIRQGKGAAQPNISQLILKHAVVHIPTPPEQERILRKLDNLFRLCSHVEVKFTEQRILAQAFAKTMNVSDI